MSPRIPPLSAAEFAERAGSARLDGVTPRALEDAPLLNILATFGHHPGLLAGFLPLGRALNAASLPERDRELVILRVARNNDCHYERAHHARIASSLGIDLTAEPDAADRDLLTAVDELGTGEHRISDASWERLRKRYSTPQLLELLTLAGTYTMVAYVLNSCGTPVEDWVDSERETK
ncbi:carboxymuconolactone decarboxylase family protein [Sciscionella sediminilitoris]|uniref:carboxymuconolactone decarboxylase family protein n=1 Tax=Sciscionella sediminilitoris TaxID=1445613 RepID=UPI00068F3A50|nr:carboxymuconolactone decarboxylase family protein [Sciscionella sp. SE31]